MQRYLCKTAEAPVYRVGDERPEQYGQDECERKQEQCT